MDTWQRYGIWPIWPVRMNTGKLAFLGSVMRRKLPNGAFEYRELNDEEIAQYNCERAW